MQIEEHRLNKLKGRTAQLEGYPTFATFIARDRDAAIYRSFKGLSARSLLHQQSELHDLERRLEELDSKDTEDIENERAQKASVCWGNFSVDTSQEAEERRKLHAEIREKLKNYRLCSP